MLQAQATLTVMPSRDFRDFVKYASRPEMEAEERRLHQAAKSFGNNVRSFQRDMVDGQLRELRNLKAQLLN